MLVDSRRILAKANREHYAVGAFNVNNLEFIQAVAESSGRLSSPVIIQTSESAISYAGLKDLYLLIRESAESSKVPIVMHLDHGREISLIKKCINIGYTSVMIDASHERFEKNISLTKKVVSFASKKGIPVEGELGTIGGAEDYIKGRSILYTDPDKAKEFVESTGISSLAVAIGTSHGAYKFKKRGKLRIDILKDIKRKVKIPLVLHGASSVPPSICNMANRYGAYLKDVKGVPRSELKLSIQHGISKINTDTDLRIAFDAAIRRHLYRNRKDINPRAILGDAKKMISKVVENKIILFGSRGKA